MDSSLTLWPGTSWQSPEGVQSNPQHKTVNGYLAASLYDAIRVDDGTVVTFYLRSDDVWAMVSSHAYDVSLLFWSGPSLSPRLSTTWRGGYTQSS